MHYYTFNIANYRKRTAHLTHLEHGIYRALIDSYYLDEQPLCGDDAKLMRTHCIRTTEEKEAFLLIIEEFFIKDNGVYRHKDCEENLKRVYEKSEKARESAKARWAKNANASKSNANASFDSANADKTQCERNANGMLPNNLLPNNLLPTKNTMSTKADHVVEIFSYWCKIMGKNENQAKLTPKRKKAIQARIKDGYTIDQIKQAIDGCRADAFSMGDNDRHKPFNDIELICRTGEKLEAFFEPSRGLALASQSTKVGRLLNSNAEQSMGFLDERQ